MRKIIVADIISQPGAFTITAYFWLVSPASRYLRPQTSRLPTQGSNLAWGITVAEQDSFSKGLLTEVQITTNAFATGTTAAAVEAALVNYYNAEQAKLDATANAALASFIGVAWDGTAWA